MIKDAAFTSVWDNGTEVTTPCKVDTVTKEVFDIEVAHVSGMDVLTDEYVTLEGEDHPVSTNPIITTYWYN